MIIIGINDSNNIAVLDSGVDMNNRNMLEHVIDGKSFENQSRGIGHNDDNGHGTNCMSIINKITQNSCFYIIKVLDKDLKASSDKIIQALEYLCNINIIIANLSFSSDNIMYKDDYERLCKKLVAQGKILVSSKSNDGGISYPASIDSVFGVEGNSSLIGTEFLYCHQNIYQIIASSLPEFAQSLGYRYSLFGGNSKATAVVTGIIYNLLKEENFEIDKIEKHLQKKSLKTVKQEMFFEKDYKINCENNLKTNDCMYFNEIESIVCEILKLNKEKSVLLNRYKLYSTEIGVNKHNCFDIILNIEKVLNISINYKKINLHHFDSIYTLCSLLIEEG